jgi:hypothetical protein
VTNTVHVALASTYPTEKDARAAIDANTDTPYLGIWTMPLPYGGTVHVFTNANPDRLETAGWTRQEQP